ncbi:Uncharacterized protein FKW44_013540, partial [Caligus rogercresseyi]
TPWIVVLFLAMDLQRPNVYNRFLPFYETDFEGDALKFLKELQSRLDLSGGLPSPEDASRFAVDLHKVSVRRASKAEIPFNTDSFSYIILYGFRFSREEHEALILRLYGLLLSKYDPLTLDSIAKILVYLLKRNISFHK